MTTTEVVKEKKETLFSLRRLPQVIEMYIGSNATDSAYCTYHLYYWLRLYAIPGKPNGGGSYPDGALLSRKDANLIKFSVRDVFGNFAFLYPRVGEKRAKRVAQALARASKIFWKHMKGRGAHTMQVVAEPKSYGPLHKCFLILLNSSRFDTRNEEEVERLTEYFVIFCQENRKILKELVIKYHFATRDRDTFMRYLPED